MSRDDIVPVVPAFIMYDGVPARTLAEWQVMHKQWVDYNFPKSKPMEPAMGLVEEVGELFHCLLKQEQGIRGSHEEHEAKMRDCVGDIFMYLMDFCSKRDISISQCVEETWEEIAQRDWIKYPKDGRTS